MSQSILEPLHPYQAPYNDVGVMQFGSNPHSFAGGQGPYHNYEQCSQPLSHSSQYDAQVPYMPTTPFLPRKRFAAEHSLSAANSTMPSLFPEIPLPSSNPGFVLTGNCCLPMAELEKFPLGRFPSCDLKDRLRVREQAQTISIAPGVSIIPSQPGLRSVPSDKVANQRSSADSLHEISHQMSVKEELIRKCAEEGFKVFQAVGSFSLRRHCENVSMCVLFESSACMSTSAWSFMWVVCIGIAQLYSQKRIKLSSALRLLKRCRDFMASPSLSVPESVHDTAIAEWVSFEVAGMLPEVEAASLAGLRARCPNKVQSASVTNGGIAAVVGRLPAAVQHGLSIWPLPEAFLVNLLTNYHWSHAVCWAALICIWNGSASSFGKIIIPGNHTASKTIASFLPVAAAHIQGSSKQERQHSLPTSSWSAWGDTETKLARNLLNLVCVLCKECPKSEEEQSVFDNISVCQGLTKLCLLDRLVRHEKAGTETFLQCCDAVVGDLNKASSLAPGPCSHFSFSYFVFASAAAQMCSSPVKGQQVGSQAISLSLRRLLTSRQGFQAYSILVQELCPEGAHSTPPSAESKELCDTSSNIDQGSETTRHATASIGNWQTAKAVSDLESHSAKENMPDISSDSGLEDSSVWHESRPCSSQSCS